MSFSLQPLLVKLVAEYHEELVRFLVGRVRCRRAAAELAQEAYVRIARHSDLGQVLDLKAYLFRVALNLLSDHQRASARHASAMQDVASLYADLVETRTPEARVMAAEELEMIATALRGLSPLCLRVFYLNRICGHKHRDIARRLGIARRTVEANLKRALEHLDRCLERH